MDLPPLPEDSSDGPAVLSPGSPCSVGGATTNDLRFHQLHGTNAVITNGGRTALRQNCRSEFNDAIVISNRYCDFNPPWTTVWGVYPPVMWIPCPSRCLRDGELFEIVIQKMVDRWSGSIEAGELKLPSP